MQLSSNQKLKPVLQLAFICLFAFSVEAHETENANPNIVYILADDLGYVDVQCLNPTRGKIKTPCLDKLAAQGMTFTDAHSGSSVCTPTRYGLLTGATHGDHACRLACLATMMHHSSPPTD